MTVGAGGYLGRLGVVKTELIALRVIVFVWKVMMPDNMDNDKKCSIINKNDTKKERYNLPYIPHERPDKGDS